MFNLTKFKPELMKYLIQSNMKTFMRRWDVIIVLSVCAFLILMCTSCLTTPAMRENAELRVKVDQLEKEVKQLRGDTTIEITSQIVEIKPDYRNMPSYCDPNKYSIAKIGTQYFARLPGGTLGDISYKTPEEVQKEINKWADISKQRWLQTGGKSF